MSVEERPEKETTEVLKRHPLCGIIFCTIPKSSGLKRGKKQPMSVANKPENNTNTGIKSAFLL